MKAHPNPSAAVVPEIVQLLARHEPPAEDRPIPAPHGLSPREFEVLRLIAAGKTDRQITETLFVSPSAMLADGCVDTERLAAHGGRYPSQLSIELIEGRGPAR